MLKILVIEDDPIDLISIKAKIRELGYPEPVTSSHDTDLEALVTTTNPQLIISDIYYNKKPLGLALIDICLSHDIPLILMTADTRVDTYNLANKHHNVTYLVKPFHYLTLQSCIDLVMKGMNTMTPADEHFCYVKDYANNKVKLHYRDILFIRADGNFCHIQCQLEHYMIRISLAHFSEQLDDQFVQVHKSFIVNKAHVNKIAHNHIIIITQEIPIGRKYRNVVAEIFPVIKNKTGENS
ncbi:MAG TPA: response regulator transcription factor [Ferruginibacter sp.]|jgi:DNA-binding LytR/AlgR family response regulator|nr:response regulator transcription factor [Ferruginibacter sp.]